MLESMSATLKSVTTQEINEASCFLIISVERADINGIEQLSICKRFLKDKNLHEEFIGFYLLKKFDAESTFNLFVFPPLPLKNSRNNPNFRMPHMQMKFE
ncbi:hypothetical protein QTP88_017845 [Uroleucon formosanum]